MNADVDTWLNKMRRLKDLQFGIITKIMDVACQEEPNLEIRLTDGSRIVLTTDWTPFDTALAGSLVFVSRIEQRMYLSRHGELRFHGLRKLDVHKQRKRRSKGKGQKLKSLIDAEVEAEARKVVEHAWHGVAGTDSTESTAKRVKRAALGLIKLLPYYLAGRVQQAVCENDWKLLLDGSAKEIERARQSEKP